MKLALLVLFAGTTLAAPYWVLPENLPRAEVKEVGCTGSRFQNGKKMVYEYRGETVNTIEGSTKRTTGLQLKALVTISSLSECKFMMSLSNVELFTKSMEQEAFTKSVDSGKLQSELEKFNIGFSMSGESISNLYTHPNEPTHILNMKRAIVSSLQFDDKQTTETDINGDCTYEITTESGKITKTKKLSECSNCAQNEIGLQVSSFKTMTDLKPLDSQSTCTYEMNGNEINNVMCNEVHVFRPFSAGYKTPSGSMTTVKTTMKLVTDKPAPVVKIVPNDFQVKKSLRFDHSSEEMVASKSIKDQFERVMSRLVNPTNKLDMSAKQDSAHEFSTLVFLLRKMDEKRMQLVWDKYFNCKSSGVCTDDVAVDVYRQYLLDAIAYCGTTTCFSIVKDQIVSEKIQGDRMTMFLQSIALVTKTDLKIIEDVFEICKKMNTTVRQAYLTLGTLMKRHCSKNEDECKSGIISKIERFLAEKLGNDCSGQNDDKRVEEILMVLKAIGNAQRPVDIQDTLMKCAENSQHTNITSSIFDAMRGMSCSSLKTGELVKMIKNINLPEETRIHAFITVMRCPTKEMLLDIVSILENEESKHVASFMWSYLSNLKESADPRHELVQKILADMKLKEADHPFHKFSKAFEKSMHSEFLKSGITTEGHLIYNKDAVLPKMGTMNVKGHVMGIPVNMLETKIGLDGVQPILETLAGPDGMLPKDFTIDLGYFGKFKGDYLEKMLKKENPDVTGNENIIKMQNKINKKYVPPTAHMSVKIMDQEVKVLSYDDILWLIDQIDNMNVVQLLKNYAQGQHKVFSKSLMFLEMTHTVPTGLGLPLKLKLTGTSVSTLELNGKFDIRNLFWGTPSMLINGYVKPATVIELSGQMGIEGHYVSSGMFVNSSMYMSHMMKGGIEFKHGQILKINLDTPEEPMHVMNFSSTPFLFMNDETEMVEGAERKISPDYCLKSAIVGYGICANMRIPVAFREYEAPYYPLSGPSSFGLKLVRGDEKMTTWQFLIKMTKKSADMTTGIIEFSTPGATYERRMSGEMAYSTIGNNKNLILSVGSDKKAALELSYNTETRRTAIITKNNLFSTKDVTTKLIYFNQTTGQSSQYGLTYSAEYDWYKFTHTTKFVTKTTGYKVETTTTYYPDKSVSGSIEWNTNEKKLTSRMNIDQLQRSYELAAKYSEIDNEKGVTITGTCEKSGKTITFYSGFKNLDNVKQLIFSADVLGFTAKNVMGYYYQNEVHGVSNFMSINGKIIEFQGNMISEKDTKTIKLNANIVGNTAVSTFVLTNKDAEKSLAMTVNAMDKTGNMKVGYYVTGDNKEWKFDFNFMGKQGEVFANWTPRDHGKTIGTVGATYDKYIAGLRAVYTTKDSKEVCSSMYYGTTDKEITPFTLCVELKTLSTANCHKLLTVSVDIPSIKKTGALTVECEQKDTQLTLTSGIQYNKEELASKKLTVKYSTDMNNEISIDLKAGKYIMGGKWYTTKTPKGVNVGMSSYAMDKSVEFVMRYVRDVLPSGSLEFKTISELYINKEIMPVTTEVSFSHGNSVSGPALKFNVGKYSLSTTAFVTYSDTLYALDADITLNKGEQSLFKIFKSTTFTSSKDSKNFKQLFGFIRDNKKYAYGWDMAYENQGTAEKMAHVVKVGIQYSIKRRSSVTFTLSNDAKQALINIDVEYIPSKTVSHYVKYSKEEQKLEMSAEFLPKMFAKFTTELNKKKGYNLESTWELSWNNYKKSVNMMTGYISNDNKFEVSMSLGKNVMVAATYMKNKPYSLSLSANVFENSGEMIWTCLKRTCSFKVVANGNMLVNFGIGYDDVSGLIKFAIENTKGSFFKIVKDYLPNKDQHTLTLFGKNNKEWFQVATKFNKKQKVGKLFFYVLEKEYLRFVVDKNGDSYTFKMHSPELQKMIKFDASIDRELKSFTVSANMDKDTVGYTGRFDWVNYIMAETFFYNDKSIGYTVTLGKHSITLKGYLSPTMVSQIVFELQEDRIVKVTWQRSEGLNLVNETSFTFRLSETMSAFVFNWNVDTTNKFIDMMKPIVNKMMRKINKYSDKAIETITTCVNKCTKEFTTTTFNFVNNMDKAFDDFDFVAARDTVGDLSLSAIQKFSEVVRKSLKLLIQGLESVKTNIPELMKQYKQLLIQFENVKVTLKKLSKEGYEMISNMQGDLEMNLNKINKVIMTIATNLTESTKPVINKAIELIKDFKIRGKPIKEIVVIVKDEINKYVEIYSKEMTAKFAEMKVKSIEMYKKGVKYILKVKVPYRDETVEEVIEIVTNKALELKGKITEIDIEKMLQEAKVNIMEYQINGKTVSKHLVVLQKDFKNLPENTRLAIHQLIKLIREYAALINTYSTKFNKAMTKSMKKVQEFSEPMTKYLVLVGKSVDKHFNPIVKEQMNKIAEKINAIELPKLPNMTPLLMEKWRMIEEFLLPLIKPIVPLYNNLKNQILKIKVMDFTLGPLVQINMDMIEQSVTTYMKQTTDSLTEQMATFNNYIETVSQMTPEQMVDNVFDKGTQVTLKTIEMAKDLYSKREEMLRKLITEMKNLYAQLLKQYNEFKTKPVSEMMETFMQQSTNAMTKTVEELTNVIKQIAELEISKPTWQAWKDADVINHMAKYGINQKMMDLIKSAKDVNITKTAVKTVKMIQDFMADLYAQAFVKAVKFYGSMENVYDYIRSIPKKTYDQWFTELKEFYWKNYAEITKMMTKVYESSSKNVQKMYTTAKTMSEVNYEQVMKEYIVPTQQYYQLIAEKSQLVYNDVKQPTIDVTLHYKNTVQTFAEENYEIIKDLLVQQYKELYPIVERKLNEFYAQMETKMADLKELIEKNYVQFLEKYGDMTWEQIYDQTYLFAENKFEDVKVMALKEYKKLNEKIMELKGKLEVYYKDMYEQGIGKYMTYKNYLENEIKPKVIEFYQKYRAMVEAQIEKYTQLSKAYYEEFKGKAMTIYNENKGKSLKKLYIEIKNEIVKQLKIQYELLKDLALKKYQLASELGLNKYTDAKDLTQKYLNEAEILILTTILPEVKAEIESLVNQTLRASVIMGKEIVKAYKPHAIIVKDLCMKAFEIVKDQAIVTYKQTNVMFQENVEKLIVLVKDLIEKMKNCETLKKVREHEYVVKATQKLEDVLKMTQEKYEELKNHPKTHKYTKMVKKQIKQLEKQLKEYKEQLDTYMADERVVKALKVLNQIKQSLLFTTSKIGKDVTKAVDEYMNFVEGMVKTYPTLVQEIFGFFVENPEQAFWISFNVAKEMTRESYNAVIRVMNKDAIVDIAKMTQRVFQREVTSRATTFYNEYLDDWTKDTAKMVYNQAQKYYTEIEKRAQDLPAEIKEQVMKFYKEKMVDVTEWYKVNGEKLSSGWTRCPYREFFVNPIWGEIADEVMTHEIADLVRDLAAMTSEKVSELKVMLMKEYELKLELLQKKMTELRDLTMTQYGELKIKLEEQIEMLKEQYKQLKEKYNQMIIKVDKFLEETTIEDIVNFVQEKYTQALVKIEETKVMLMNMKTEYINKAKAMYAEYEEKVMKMYQEYKTKAMKMYEQYKTEAMKMFEEYKTEAMKMYEEYKTKAIALYKEYEVEYMPIYKKYEAMVMKYYKEYETSVTEYYNKYYPIVVAKYDKYLKMVLEEYSKLKAQSFMMVRKYEAQIKQMIKDGKTTMIQMWKDSELRTMLITFKKMTIRETIEALKQLPKNTQVFAVNTYNKYSKLAVENYNKYYTLALDKYNQYYALAVENYNKYYDLALDRLVKEYTKLMVELVKQRDLFVEMMKPYYTPVYDVYKWTENEIKLTALFVYRYYQLEERYMTVKSYLESEYTRLTPIMRAKMEETLADLKQKMEVYKKEFNVYSEKYSKEAMKMAQDYSEEAVKMAKKYGSKAGHKVLRSIHSGLKYLDTVDASKVQDELTKKAKDMYKSFTQYVTIDTLKGEITVAFPHPEIKPSFTHHYNKIEKKAIRTIRSIKEQGNKYMDEINAKLSELKAKMDVLKEKIQSQIMENTKEIRQDLASSLEVNTRVYNKLYNKASVVYQKAYNKFMNKYTELKSQTKEYLVELKKISKEYYDEMMAIATKVYIKGNEIVMDIYSSPYSEMYTKTQTYAVKYYTQLKSYSTDLYTTYKPILKNKWNKYTNKMEIVSKKYYKTMKPYLNTIEKVYTDIKSGMPIEQALKPITKQVIFAVQFYQEELMKELKDMKVKICNADPKLCKAIKDSLKVHSFIFNKYAQRFTKVMESTMEKYIQNKAKLYTVAREFVESMINPEPYYNVVATTFGNHYITFDNKMYTFEVPTKKCQYVLTHDFAYGTFTVTKGDDFLKIKTKDMKVVIYNNGKTITTLPNNQVEESLPVEFKDSKCVRKQNLVFCHFAAEGFKVVKDLKNDITTFSVSQWHHGKLLGLLGTNNGETFDDLKMSNGKITNDEAQFIQSFEISKQCPSPIMKVKKCNRPSKLCKQIIKDAEYAKFHSIVAPEKFFEACQVDTSACKKNAEETYCQSANAYVQAVRSAGYAMKHLTECVTDGQRSIGDKWTVKSKNNIVDVVVMISARNGQPKRDITKVLQNLNQKMKKNDYDVNYALIGFGGAGIHEEAHVHALGEGVDVFGNMNQLLNEIQRLSFNGQGTISNDAYHAIKVASQQHFRTGSQKIFIMFNVEPHNSFKFGASYTEAFVGLTHDADAGLYVFDEFNLKNLGEKGSIIGQSLSKTYTTNEPTGHRIENLELPASEFKEMIEASNGAVFDNKIENPNKVTKSLFDAINSRIEEYKTKCHSCELVQTWHGLAKSVCKMREVC